MLKYTMVRSPLFLILYAFSASMLFGASPIPYERHDTWRETLDAYLSAHKLSEGEETASTPPKKLPQPTELLRGGQEARKVSIDVRGENHLILVATDGGDGNGNDHSAWVNARLMDSEGNTTWLDELKASRISVGYGKFIVRSNDVKTPVLIGTKPYPRYLWAHANSAVRYRLGGKYERFEAWVGVDQRKSKGMGSVTFVALTGTHNIDSYFPEDKDADFWSRLLTDFPDDEEDIQLTRAWSQNVGLFTNAASSYFELRAKATLAVTKQTFRAVQESNPDDELALRFARLEGSVAQGKHWRHIWLEARALRHALLRSRADLTSPGYGMEKVDLAFNKTYTEKDISKPMSWVDTKAALSAVALHRGLLFAPLGTDHGGGQGRGAFAFFNIDDPYDPVSVFDSRDYPGIYHDRASRHYAGDFAEAHGMSFSGDLILMSERRKGSAGFSILDLGPLFDADPDSKPRIISRFSYPGVDKPTNYDGYSFSLVWSGKKYVFAPTGSHGLYIVDTTDLNAPRLVAHLSKAQLYNENVRSSVILGDLLILSPGAVASSKESIVFVDVSDPAQPHIISKHRVGIGYQGFVYGSKFYGGGTRVGKEPSKLMTYDFSDPENIREHVWAETKLLKKPEYGFAKDDDMYIGHYPGLIKWKVDGGKAIFETVIEPQYPKADDYAFVSPAGNLAIVTSDHNVKSRMNLGIHDRNPDHRGPELRYVLPKKGATRVSRNAKIGVSFSDFIDPLSLSYKTLVLRKVGEQSPVECTYGHYFGIVNIVPSTPLEANSSYEVVVTGSVRDQVGNSFTGDRSITRFSTEKDLQHFSVDLKVAAPTLENKPVPFKATVQGLDTAKAEFAWDFGDETPLTAFSSAPMTHHTFAKAGNYSVTLHARERGTDAVIRISAVQVIHARFPEERAQSSSTIVFDGAANRIYVVNPDNDSLTALDAPGFKKLYEVRTGANPVSLAIVGPHLWVSNHGDDTLSLLRADDGKLVDTLRLPHGSAPYGLIHDARRQRVFLTLSGKGELVEFESATRTIRRKLPVGESLRHLACVPSRNRLLLPHFIARGVSGGKLSVVDSESWRLVKTLELQPSLNPDGLNNGRGQPNYLGALAVSPDQRSVVIPGKKDNVFLGGMRDGKPLVFDHTVRSLAVNINVDSETETFERRLDLDNSGFATSALYSPYGDMLFVSTLGSSTIWAIDAHREGNRFSFDSAGLAPIGIASDQKGTRIFIHNFISRSVAIFDTSKSDYYQLLASVQTVSKETLKPEVMAGKKLFFDSRNARLSQEGYMSCASCHMDGAHDGRVWDLTTMGEGFRNTIDLRGRGGMKHGPLHWSANFDEVHDFEIQIRALNQGLGLIDDRIYNAHGKAVQASYGSKKTGLSTDLDNLAAYVGSLDRYPRSPHREASGEMTADAMAGRQHFINLSCYTCHSGDDYTDSAIGRSHDVGTFTRTTGKRLGQAIEGLDTPSLVGLWQSAPYLHDGSAATLHEVFTERNANQLHGKTKGLSPVQRGQLVAFLLQLEAGEGIRADEVNSKNRAPQFAVNQYRFTAYHGVSTDTAIGRVQASDADVGQKLAYYLVAGDAAGSFSVSKDTGEIYFHGKDLYGNHPARFQVMVEDDGGYIQRARVWVHVDTK